MSGLLHRGQQEKEDEDVEGEEKTERGHHKAKRLLQLPVRKVRGLLRRRKKTRPSSRDSLPPPPAPLLYPYEYDDLTIPGRDCYLCCFNPRRAPPSSPVEPIPNPASFSSSSSSHHLLRSLIEKNDFYSKECNVHCDVQLPAGADKRSSL